ncbi:MAG: metalloregulator ArsR/SmtB family transcription factor [Polyangiales bacterium]
MANYSSQLDGVFHALSDPTRRAVVARLGRGSAAVSELAQPFDLALPTFLKHLKVLEDCGLVKSEKAGRVRTYELVPKRLSLAEQWMADQRALWDARLDRLDSYLAELQRQEVADKRGPKGK